MNKKKSTTSNNWMQSDSEKPIIEDLDLIIASQKGNMEAFDALVTKYRGKIYAMIQGMLQNEAEAWDISQDVFVKAWQAIKHFEAKAQFSSWLYRIAHNATCDFMRKKRPQYVGKIEDEFLNQDLLAASDGLMSFTAESPKTALENQELKASIRLALSKITPDQRQIIILKDLQGLSYKEIADAMDCTIGTVMSRLFYARQKLQKLLKHEYESR